MAGGGRDAAIPGESGRAVAAGRAGPDDPSGRSALSAAAPDADLDDDAPLDGVRVLEVGGGIAAAFAARQLAGFGADVVRVEGRHDGPGLTRAEEIYLVAGKRRVVVDDGELRALALASDIVIEDARPGRLAELGAAPADLRALRPALVVVSITPFGQTGPSRHWKSTNAVSFAMGGIMSLTGDHRREPLLTGGSQAEYLAGLHGFAAAVTAWFGATVHGEGDWIDLSAQEAAAGMLELYGPSTAYGEPVRLRMGNQTRAEWGIYPCLDGYIGLFALQRQIRSLFDAMGQPELGDGPMGDAVHRLSHVDELAAHIYAFTLSHTREELMELGRRHRVPMGVALTPAELLESPDLATRGLWETVEAAEGPATVPGRPFAGLGWRPLGRLHQTGADTGAVLDDWVVAEPGSRA